jgi:hypothetical protein
MNHEPVIANANTTDSPYFLSKFPPNAFDITFTPNSSSSFGEFSNEVTSHGHEQSPAPPFMYGSYQFYELDARNHNYKVITFANLTSRDSSVLFTHFMHEAVL